MMPRCLPPPRRYRRARRRRLARKNPSFAVGASSSMSTTLAAALAVVGAVGAFRRFHPPAVELEYRNPTISALVQRLRLLTKGYRPPALLPSGIMQSLMADQYAPDPRPVFRRQEVELAALDFGQSGSTGRTRTACCPEVVPAGVCSLDWLDVPNERAPIVILVPGLTGSSSSPYIQRTAVALHATGARVAVFNPRSRGGVELRSPFLYSAGYTEDLRRVVEIVRSSAGGFPGAMLLGAGFSLGSSYLLKYCCEEGDACVLRGAALFACPIDCTRMGKHLESSPTGKLVNPALVRSGSTPATAARPSPCGSGHSASARPAGFARAKLWPSVPGTRDYCATAFVPCVRRCTNGARCVCARGDSCVSTTCTSSARTPPHSSDATGRCRLSGSRTSRCCGGMAR